MRDAIAIKRVQGVHIGVTELLSEWGMAQERRVAYDELGRRPLRLRGIFLIRQIQDRIGLYDGHERSQDRAVVVGESVVLVPLDVTNPKRRAGQLSGVWVDLKP